MIPPLYTLHTPQLGQYAESEPNATPPPLPIIANLPHSGLALPPKIAEKFLANHRRHLPNSDWHLQQLYSFLPSLGVMVLQANYSRYVVDLNRALNLPYAGSFWSSVVPLQTAFKKDIYRRLPSESEVRSRVDTYYKPYHEKLGELLHRAIAHYGHVTLLDLHSFYGLIDNDVCLGNGNGTTCSADLLETVRASFSRANFDTVTNKVFTGGHITRHYGSWPNVDALQIELRYTTYLPDDQIEVDTIPTWSSAKFEQTREKFKWIFQHILESTREAV